MNDKTIWLEKTLSLLIFIIISFIVISDAMLILPHSSLLEVYDSVPDEVLFYSQANLLAGYLLAGNWHAVSTFGTPYGYGFPFWLTAAILKIVLPDATVYGLALYKLMFLLMKWSVFGSVAAMVWRRHGVVVATSYIILVASCSAFFFYGKVFSPEYETLAFSAISIVLICHDNFRLKWQASAALTSALLATSIKISAAPVLMAVGLYLVIAIWIVKDDRLLKLVSLISAIMIATLLFGIPFMTEAGRTNAIEWNAQNVDRHLSFQNVLTWLNFRVVTWDQIALSGVMGYLGALTACIFSITLFKRGILQIGEVLIGRILVFCGFSGAIFIVCSDGYLDWYLWVPAFLVIVGTILSVNRIHHWQWTMLVTCFSVLLFSAPETLRRMDIRRDVLAMLGNSGTIHLRDEEYFHRVANCNIPIVVATDLLIALQTSSFPNLAVVRMRDLITLNMPNNTLFRSNGMLPTKFFYDGPDIVPDKKSITHLVVNSNLLAKGTDNFGSLGNVSILPDGTMATFDGRQFQRSISIGNRVIYQDKALSLCNP
ncbi:hypothetical protein KSI86_17225 [Dickeya oryzae]|uniref:hypothetical protein n=1 Tax=Dickeya oryzae TaxID=1240404 RepID=UPI0020983A04|nr:hypothetical protein [Dickeya oryzae]MCO7255898.1 hypothetical protein [Dickeya oryzae]